MLNFILGRAGVEKSTDILNKIKQSVSSSTVTYLIVPEQFTFESEKKYLRELGASALSNLRITSFSRIAHNIFKEYGGTARDYADKSKKLCLINMALHQIYSELSLYNKIALNTSFSENVLQIVDELKNAGMDEESFSEKIDNMPSGILKEKNKDIELIFNTYNAMLSQNYKDNLDDISRAIDLIKNENYFDGANIFIDEFTGFTKVELDFIELMLSKANSVSVSLCMDTDILKDKIPESNIFYTVYKTYNEIKLLARQLNVKVLSNNEQNPVIVENKRFHSKDLVHLEKNLFNTVPETYTDKATAIKCMLANTEYDEIDFACITIRDLVENKGFKYKDINIVSRDLTDYNKYLQTALRKYEIPYYVDTLKSVSESPLIRLIGKVFDCVNNINSQSLVSILKCGLSPYNSTQIAELENYIYLWNIKGSQWKEDFTYCTEGVKVISDEEELEIEKQKLLSLNEMRDYLFTPINKFKKLKSPATSLEISKVLAEFLEETGVRLALSERIKQLDVSNNGTEDVETSFSTDNTVLAQEYKRSWEIVSEVINILIEVLGDEVVEKKRYFELFNLVISNFDVGTIPQSLDCVIIGEARRMRTENVKALIILGANDKVFPFVPTSSGIYTDDEREKMIESGISLSAPLKDKIREEKFIVYKTLTLPSDYLYITARLSNLKGEVKTPSHIIPLIQQMFVDSDIVEETVNIDPLEYCRTYDTAFSVLAKNYRRDKDFVATLKEYFSQIPEYASKIESIERILTKGKFELKNKDVTYNLFGKKVYMSPSRVELFHQCKFMYFCDYGLKLKKREQVKMTALNRGLVIHDMLHNVCVKIKNISNIEDAVLKQIISEELETYVANNLHGYDKTNKRLKYLYNRIKNTVFLIMKRFLEEINQSEFKPTDFEYTIGNGGKAKAYKIKSEDGVEINLIGTIDRIDMYKSKSGEKYVRVVDYKSGLKKFKLSDILNGVNLQMFLYLMCLEKNGIGEYKNSNPAGVLYMPASDVPSKLGRNTDDTEIQKEIKEHYKMSGVILGEEDILKAMEKSLKGEYLPVSLKASGYDKERKPKSEVFSDNKPIDKFFYASSIESMVSRQEMGKMFSCIERTVEKMVEELYSGNIEAKPLKGKSNDPCAYCSYKNVCLNSDNGDCIEYIDCKKEDVLNKIDEME